MNKEEVKKYLDNLNLVFYGIVAIPLVAFSYLYLENQAGRITPQVSDEIASGLQYVFPTVIIVLCGMGLFIPGFRIRKIDQTKALKPKLHEFQGLLLLRYAFFEIACISSVAGFYLTAQSFYSVFFIATLILFSLNRPTPYRVITNLKLGQEEKELF